MSQEHSTPTPAATPAAHRPEWEVWLNVLSPCRTTLLLSTSPWDPSPPDEWTSDDELARWKLFHRTVDQPIARVPRHLDLGRDEYGCPTIAYQAWCDVVVRDPDGRERVVFTAYKHIPAVIGWKTLREYWQRERKGEGAVEDWENRETPDGLLVWSWNEKTKRAKEPGAGRI
jgi:hypothetical protein